jgi:hypothetical protein
MAMPSYVIHCTASGCAAPAQYKIAAEWSDGSTHELKTYGLACAAHLAPLFQRAVEKATHCHLAEGESLSRPGIYELATGKRDRALKRVAELEGQRTP